MPQLWQDRRVDPVREYVEESAGGDVQATLAWLDSAGFRITQSHGGRGESFGNAMLLFSGEVDVQVVRDRGQWDIAVAPRRDGHWYSLAVLAAAREGRDWEPSERDLSADLPRQLPSGGRLVPDPSGRDRVAEDATIGRGAPGY